MPRTPSARPRGRPSGTLGPGLLAVARELFISRGFHGTTMDAVAAQAGISKQTLYAAHPSKDALYAAVVRDWVDRGYDAMRPRLQVLRDSVKVRAGLLQLAATLQGGILSPPVLQMRALIAEQADAFPDVAADYIARSWDCNIDAFAEALEALTARGLLVIDKPRVAAEQFVWLVVGAPLNRLSLCGSMQRATDHELRDHAAAAVETFLSRYGPPTLRVARRDARSPVSSSRRGRR